MTVPEKAAHLIASEETPNDELTPIIATVGRTWEPWALYLLNFSMELHDFAKNKIPNFA